MQNSMQDAASQPLETDKTNQTSQIDRLLNNFSFLNELFRLCPEGMPATVSFAGQPAKGDWSATPWDGSEQAAEQLPQMHNNYVSLAVFGCDEDGVYRRRKKQFVAIAAIVLDDVGTKVATDKVVVPPSWRLETSPGNFQVGYLFDAPITDLKSAEALSQALINAGLTDPGMSAPATRLFRLPGGCNGKHMPAFVCQLSEWEPSRRYSIKQLVDGFGLDLSSVAAGRKGRVAANSSVQVNSVAHYQPRPAANPVIEALKARGLYKQALSEGRHDITCPWVDEHTDSIDCGTAYFEPSGEYHRGGFKCQHAHCAERHLADLLAFLGVDSSQAALKAKIMIQKGALDQAVRAMESILSERGDCFQRSGKLVRLRPEPGSGVRRIDIMTPADLTLIIAESADCYQYDGRCKDYLPTDPPPRHLSTLFDAGSYEQLPILRGIARQPFFLEDGSLIARPGYDARSGYFGVFDPAAYPLILSPSQQESEIALQALKDLLKEFPFRTEHDLAAALAALMTAVLRVSLPGAPMIHVRSHTFGSGKSMLCDLIAALASSRLPEPASFPADNEECGKMLLSVLMSGPDVVLFDNLTTDLLPHASLCSVLTAGTFTRRALGLNQMVTVDTRALFLSNGNNVGPVQDMARRCLTIDLDPQCEMPVTRTFSRPNLLEEVLRERERYVAYVLTVVLGWMSAGQPQAACQPLAGFTRWSDWVRQPLLWLGLADPLLSTFEAIDQDPERELLGRLLLCWQRCFGMKPTEIHSAIQAAGGVSQLAGSRELLEIMHEVAGDQNGGINTRRLGKFLSRHQGKIVDGLRFAQGNSKRSVAAWRVDAV